MCVYIIHYTAHLLDAYITNIYHLCIYIPPFYRYCMYIYVCILLYTTGEGIYNFGEIITHPILAELKGTANGWLYDLMVCIMYVYMYMCVYLCVVC